MCCAAGSAWSFAGISPRACSVFAASFFLRWPSMAGKPQSPARSPCEGRFLRAILPFFDSRKIVSLSVRRLLGGVLWGNSACRLASLARHRRSSGQEGQRAAPRGRQTRAPSSIKAWLKSPAFSGRRAISASSTARFVLSFKMSAGQARRRMMTRSTLPSTAGRRSPKAMEATAPAV